MKIGIFSDHITVWAKANGLSVPEACRRFEAYGIRSLEADCAEWAGRTPTEWAKDFPGLSLRCVHGLCSLCAAEDSRFRAGLREAERIIDDAAALDAEFVLLVPARPEDVADEADRPRALERMIEGLRQSAEYAAARGIRLTLENFSIPRYPFTRPEELSAVFAAVPEVGYTLDTGNFLCAGIDVEAAAKRLPFPLLVHAKDWTYTDGPGFGQPPLDGAALGEGLIPLRRLLDSLREQGYAGDVIIEYNSQMPDAAKIQRSAAFMAAFMSR